MGLVLVLLLLLGMSPVVFSSAAKPSIYPLILSFLFLSCGTTILFAATTNSWRTAVPRC